MRALAKIGALIASVLGTGSFDAHVIRQKTRISGRRLAQYVRHARRGGGNNGRFTRWLRARFAKSALERYGLDVRGPDGKPDAETVRAMRNARKQERRQSR